MTPLLEQFLSEGRDFLQGISEKLMALEAAPADAGLINELFRLVHTFKGNSGLFSFPELTRVLHAGEDLMDAVRNGRLGYSRDLADRLLDAMDFVLGLCDEIEAREELSPGHAGEANRLAESLRRLIPQADGAPPAAGMAPAAGPGPAGGDPDPAPDPDLDLGTLPEAARLAAYRGAQGGDLHLVRYDPEEGCFFRGEDPFHLVRQTPGLLWGGIAARGPWPPLAELDPFRSALVFQCLALAPEAALQDHFRYVLDQVRLVPLAGLRLALPAGEPNGGPVYEEFVAEALDHLEAGRLAELERAARILQEFSNPALWIASALRWLLAVLAKEPDNRAALARIITSLRTLQPPSWGEPAAPAAAPRTEPAWPGLGPDPDGRIREIIEAQAAILALDEPGPGLRGRIQAAAATG